MPLRQLENLVGKGLKTEAPNENEIESLIRSGERRLKDAKNVSLSMESRFDLAYNAAHAIALAALRHHGYRSENRYLVFQTLSHTLNLAPEQWRVLDTAHRKRNSVEYEGLADVDEQTIEAVIRVVADMRERLLKIVRGER